jgi:mannose-6-phosphate isomerase-like protein (cupin superfamily)
MSLLQKPWGYSTRLFINEAIQLERIFIQGGGYSSIHLHERKYNQFVVQKGMLLINTFDDTLTWQTDIKVASGQQLTIEPNVRHQFVARSDVEAYELYWPAVPSDGPVAPEDIVRFSQNGVARRWDISTSAIPYRYCCECNKSFRAEDVLVVLRDNAFRDMCHDCTKATRLEPVLVDKSGLPVE